MVVSAVSATPSGGWLKSNPVVPGLGVPLNTRAQMFWLERSGPNALAPGRRPRSTLSPSMALRTDGARLAFGTPGGDQQDQWQLIYLLRLIHFESNLQEGIDSPLFHTGHLQASFYPRGCETAQLVVEPSFSVETRQALSDRGHRVEVAAPWSVGRLTAAEARPWCACSLSRRLLLLLAIQFGWQRCRQLTRSRLRAGVLCVPAGPAAAAGPRA